MIPREVIATIVTVAWTSAAVQAQTRTVTLDVKNGGTQTFYVDPTAGRNQISVFSESELDDFLTVCNVVSGSWQFDPGDVERLTGQLIVRVADLSTGIALRDRHLRRPEWLNSTKYPEIVIAIDHGEQAQRIAFNAASIVSVGKLSLHGVTRDVRIPCTLTYLEPTPQTQERLASAVMRLRANFEIRLSEFSVRGPTQPEFTSLLVADRLPVKASIFGSTTRPAPQPRTENPATGPSAASSKRGG